MSSMLKKTGGLAFKPKAGRRGGAGPAATASPSQAPSAPASTSASVAASITGTPVPESSTQTSTPTTSTPAPTPTPALTPAPAPASTSTVAPPTKVTNATPPSSKEHREISAGAHQSTIQPQTTEASQPTPESTTPPSNPAIKPTAETSVPTENDTIRPTQQPPTPEITTSNDTPVPAVPGPSAAAPAPALPPAPTPPAAPVSTPVPAHGLSVAPTISTAQSSATPTQPAPTTTVARLPTAPPSPPAPDTITAVAPPDGSSSTTAAPKKKRAPRKRTAPSAEGEVEGGESAPPKKKRTYRKRQPPAAEEGEAAAAATPTPTEVGEEAPQPKKAPRPRKRAPTPEDPETQEVDHSTTKMAELTRDLGIGKPFKHAEAIAERHRLARMAVKQRKLDKQKRAMGLIPDGGEADTNSRAGTPSAGNTGEGGGVSSGTNNMAAMGGIDTGAGVGYEVVDGQIVVNQSSLVVDRHAGLETQNLETVEEDEFSHQTTAASYRRPSRNVANAWTEPETERFYRLLSMFGTDFESIAAMFPGKNRRMVKCKFNREERLRPKRINAAVMVRGSKTVAIDLDEYKGFQKQWQEPEDILREHERLAEEHRRDIQRLKEERRAQGLADDSDEEGAGNGSKEGGGGGGVRDGAQGDDGVDAAAAVDGEEEGEGGNAAAMSVETEVVG